MTFAEYDRSWISWRHDDVSKIQRKTYVLRIDYASLPSLLIL
jgi:hypothetical protein